MRVISSIGEIAAPPLASIPSPLSLGDAPEVSAWFESVTPLISVSYEIRVPTSDPGQDAMLCSRATTLIATTDADGSLQAETPGPLLDRLPSL